MDLSNLHYHCDFCNEDLGPAGFDTYLKAYKAFKVKGKRGKFCSKECYDNYAKSFEIVYKDVKMYKIGDSAYVPYIGCYYYFKTAEDCYQRMQHKHMAILP